jgi:hypothetical protein
MEGLLGALRRQASRILAIVVLLTLYGLARLPEPSEGERTDVAAPFGFVRAELPALAGNASRSVRPVHPSLKRISAWISSVGAAVALNDLDGDGLPNDVCSVDTRTDQVIVAPVPGTGARYQPFALDPAPLTYDPATMAPMGCLPGDLNEDGRMDLLVYYWGRTPVAFLRRQGPMGPAAYVAREVVPGGERWYSNAATLADVDGDGHLDLIVGNYFPDGSRILDAGADPGAREAMQDSMSRAFNGGGPRLLLWKAATPGPEPTVRFAEAPGALPEGAGRGWTLAVGAADLDGDLLPEIYLANDFGPDRLLHNRSTPGRPRFVLLNGVKRLTTPNSKVLGRDSFKGMGVDFGDLNGDGWPDIVVSNIASEFALEESHFVWVSTGEPDLMRRGIAPYVDRSEPLGLSRSGWGWDAKLADFDNDGRLEMLQATGFVKGTVNRWPELHELAMGNDQLVRDPRTWHRFEPGDDLSGDDGNRFFVRGRNGRYLDVGRDLGLREPQVSRGIAIADVDGDGRLDFAVANQWGPSGFYRNACRRCGTFLGLHLLLPLRAGHPAATAVRPGHPGRDTPGRPAVGAAVAVQLGDGRRLTAQVDGGSGHSGKRSPDLHFGLGQAPGDASLRVEVRWRDPDGRVRRESLSLTPGWHTVLLGWPGPGER